MCVSLYVDTHFIGTGSFNLWESVDKLIEFRQEKGKKAYWTRIITNIYKMRIIYDNDCTD